MFKSGTKLHWIKNLYRRWRYGAGCCDTYGLMDFLRPKILPALKQFKKDLERGGGGYPTDTTWEVWLKELDEMIWAFEYEEEFSEPYNFEEDRKQQERQQKGFELFGKRFRDLWI